jgi:RNA polymerase sigma-70 factor (ECF subfamily)
MISDKILHQEETLVIKYQETGCNNAFGKLYELMYSPLFDYLCKITHNCDDAFDITQETFITAANELHNLRQPITFRFWLFRIAKHKCMKKYRKAAKETSDNYEDDFLMQDYSTYDAIIKEEQLLKLEAIMATLNDEEKLLLIQKYSEGKSIKEIMTQTSLGSSAIKMKLMRARQKVASAMAEAS